MEMTARKKNIGESIREERRKKKEKKDFL